MNLHRLPRRLRRKYRLTKAEIEYLTKATLDIYTARHHDAMVDRHRVPVLMKMI